MRKSISLYFFFVSICVYGQDVNVLQGDLSLFKGLSNIKIEFDYENILIDGGGTEKEYKARKIEYLNKKEAGRGDKFERTWNQFRIDYFEPNFTKLFLDYTWLKLNNDTAKYTLIFKPTKYTDKALLVPPNEEAEPSTKKTFMDGEAWVVETKNRENVLLKISLKRMWGRESPNQWGAGSYRVGANGAPVFTPGSNYGNTMAYYDVRVRLSFAYAKAGEELGKYIKYND